MVGLFYLLDANVIAKNIINCQTAAKLFLAFGQQLFVGIEPENPAARGLTDRKIPVEYVVYPREGHGIAEPAHQRDLMERNLRWFSQWLK